MNLAFLGAGAMGQALIRGLLESGVCAPQEIAAFDADAEKVRALSASLGIRAASDARDAAQNADVIILAVKPQMIAAALEPLRDVFSSSQMLLSIAAGISTEFLESQFSQPVAVVRVMPNTPCLVGAAASAICLGAHANESHRELAHRVFDAVGLAVDVEEKQIDAVTGLSGSGPAYVYIFIEALSDAGVRMGLGRAVATQLAAQTVLGSAQMVLQTGQHPGALKDMVTSPGGTTIAALHSLEKNAFRGAVMDAVQVATLRARELG